MCATASNVKRCPASTLAVVAWLTAGSGVAGFAERLACGIEVVRCAGENGRLARQAGALTLRGLDLAPCRDWCVGCCCWRGGVTQPLRGGWRGRRRWQGIAVGRRHIFLLFADDQALQDVGETVAQRKRARPQLRHALGVGLPGALFVPEFCLLRIDLAVGADDRRGLAFALGLAGGCEGLLEIG